MNSSPTFLESFIGAPSFEVSMSETAAVCQSCMIKINEYDEYVTKADQVKNELINIYKCTQDSSQQHVDLSPQLSEIFPEIDFDALNDSTLATSVSFEHPSNNNNDEVSEEFRKILEKEGIKYDIEVFQRAFGDEETAIAERKIQQKLNSRSKRFFTSLTCDICELKGFKNRQAFTCHLKTHRKSPFYCDFCKTSFRSANSLRIHLTTNHGTIKHDIPCSFSNCNKMCVNVTALRSHMTCHNKNEMNPSFVCDTCGKAFHYKLSFTQHLKTHTGFRDKKCEFCAFKAISSNHLQRHVRARHTKEKSHFCSYCNRAFSERYNMMTHIRKLHLDPKPKKKRTTTYFKCSFCCMEYSDNFKLQQHIEMSHGHNIGVQFDNPYIIQE